MPRRIPTTISEGVQAIERALEIRDYTTEPPTWLDLYRWNLAGSGFVGLDESDRQALGLMFELEQRKNVPLSRTIQHFIEAHCTELPPYWGERGVK